MPVPQRDWIDLVYAFAPATAALIAVGVGLMQYYLQRKQLDQDLFNKRYKVYAAAQILLNHGLRQSNTPSPEEAIVTFLSDTSHSEFLFGPEISTTLSDILSIAAEMSVNRQMIDGKRAMLAIDTDVSTLLLKQASTFDKARDLKTRQLKLFRPYLQLHHDRWWPGRLFDRINRWMDSDIPAKLTTRNDA